VWLEKEPEVTTLEYNMFEDTFGPTLEDTKSLKVYCKTAQQSAAVAPSNGPTTTVSGPSSSYSAFIPDATPIVEESDHKLKESLLINFLTEPKNLIDIEHRWWIDTTEYEEIRDGSWEPFDQPAMAITMTSADASTESQFKLGLMKYKGHSDVERTFEWMPKPDEGAEQVVKVSKPMDCQVLIRSIVDSVSRTTKTQVFLKYGSGLKVCGSSQGGMGKIWMRQRPRSSKMIRS